MAMFFLTILIGAFFSGLRPPNWLEVDGAKEAFLKLGFDEFSRPDEYSEIELLFLNKPLLKWKKKFVKKNANLLKIFIQT